MGIGFGDNIYLYLDTIWLSASRSFCLDFKAGLTGLLKGSRDLVSTVIRGLQVPYVGLS